MIISLFILLFTVSGIILNHRKYFSSTDINRKYLPEELQYNNWNLAAVKTSLKLSDDSILVYGNIGIYLTDENLSNFKDFNNGFSEGVDNRRIEKVYKTKSGDLLAATLFGVYKFNEGSSVWEELSLPKEDVRIVDIEEDNEGIILLSRSEIFRTKDLIYFKVSELPPTVDYDGKVGLFKTIWLIHSGEIYGWLGKVLVDLLGVIFAALALTGVIFFSFPSIIKRKKKKGKSAKPHLVIIKASLNWHKNLAWSLGILLFINTFTGMFLRPPLLIPIAYSEVSKIPYTVLDTPNAWFDKLRRILYKKENNTYYVATNEGLYYSDDNFATSLKTIPINVPISVMGVNVFEFNKKGKLLVGTFNGLFELDLDNNSFIDYSTKKPYVAPKGRRGSPIGDVMAAGYSNDFSKELYFDFNKGMTFFANKNVELNMPYDIKETKISLWSTALEMHTARLFKPFMGIFYILFIPLFGLATLFTIISGYVVLYKQKKKQSLIAAEKFRDQQAQ